MCGIIKRGELLKRMFSRSLERVKEMLPIYITYDSGLSEFERQAVVDAFTELDRIFPERRFVCYGDEPWDEGFLHCSADWCVEHVRTVSVNGTTQLDAGSVCAMLDGELWQRNHPHISVMIVSHDLTAMTLNGYLNFCFGFARGAATVLSVARYRDLSDSDRYLAIKTVIWHEVGHIFGMASNPARRNTEYRLGMHCTSPGCVMRQSMSLTPLVHRARNIAKMGRIFCPLCLADARRNQSR